MALCLTHNIPIECAYNNNNNNNMQVRIIKSYIILYDNSIKHTELRVISRCRPTLSEFKNVYPSFYTNINII